jgi:hypothetical protein
VVQGHGLDAEQFAQAAHGQRAESARVAQFDGRLEDPFTT